MSELSQFRDHARFMATHEHAPGCPPVRVRPSKAHNGAGSKWCGSETPHDSHRWEQGWGLSDYRAEWMCAGICGGCNSPAERALWTKLADEVDEHLAERVEVDLFGETSTEPTTTGPAGAGSEGESDG